MMVKFNKYVLIDANYSEEILILIELLVLKYYYSLYLIIIFHTQLE